MIALPPKQEAALIAYIVFQNHCDMKTCLTTIGKTIQQNGKRLTKIVYRGHSKKDSHITSRTPFFSVSPDKRLAMLFVESEWDSDGKHGVKIGNLFKLHLKHVPTLDTRDIHYTFSKEVLNELRKIVGNNSIRKGSGTYTFDEFAPKLNSYIQDLVFNDDGVELLVLNGGTFYTNASMTEQGYTSRKHPEGYTLHEAWYSFL